MHARRDAVMPRAYSSSFCREVDISLKHYMDGGHCVLLASLSSMPLLKKACIEVCAAVSDVGPVLPDPPLSEESAAYLTEWLALQECHEEEGGKAKRR